jgi:tetratricopeptide (TPR) repeat protein
MEFEPLLAHYCNQLRATLSAEYVDQSFLIGFISNLQSKVYEVIVVSLESIAAGLDTPTALSQLQKVWIQLHYKIITFYKTQHRALHAQVDAQMQQRRKNQANLPKFHPVEIRKLHDNYIKCNNLIYQFYLRIASYILATYRIDGLPPAVLRLQHPLQQPPVSVPDAARPGLVAVLYTCALNLGNLARTRSFIELTYLKPSLSIKNFYHSLKPRKSEQLVEEYYQKALEYYRMCILLAPNSNEPYSHIGMIYSSVGDRYLASYWFLRSQSTFETTFETGLKNLENTLAKDDFGKAMGSGASDIKAVFMCLLSHYYPAKWRQPQAIASQNRFQLELRLWDLINAVEPDCLECESRALANSHIFVDQIVMLVCFRHLVDDGERKKYNTFVATYIEMTIKKMQLVLKSATPRQKANCFIALRVCLAVLRGVKDVRANFAHYAVLLRLVNSLLLEHPTTRAKSTRDYLFQEDIDLKGLQLEKRRGNWKEYQLYPLVDFEDKDLHNGMVGLYGSAEEFVEHENKLR